MVAGYPPIFDAHLDLAYLAEMGRAMDRPLDALGPAGDPHWPAAVTLPELAAAGVTRCLGTVFTESVRAGSVRAGSVRAGSDAGSRFGPVAYPAGDAHAAYARGIAQLNRYHAWRRDGRIRFFGEPEPNTRPVADPDAGPDGGRAGGRAGAPIELGILIECADPIIAPADLSFWAGRGVVAVGLSWVHASRYAGGNATDTGLTPLGRELLGEMARLGVALDLSHLSQRATLDALDSAGVRVCASHSNCRALLGGRNTEGWQRHADDGTIAAVAARGGVVGLNLCRGFVRLGLDRDDPADRPSIADAVDHIDHVCQVAGSAAHAGIGSDLDGGFSAHNLPAGIDRAAHLPRLLDELASRGYSDGDITAIAHGNWSRFFGLG